MDPHTRRHTNGWSHSKTVSGQCVFSEQKMCCWINNANCEKANISWSVPWPRGWVEFQITLRWILCSGISVIPAIYRWKIQSISCYRCCPISPFGWLFRCVCWFPVASPGPCGIWTFEPESTFYELLMRVFLLNIIYRVFHSINFQVGQVFNKDLGWWYNQHTI